METEMIIQNMALHNCFNLHYITILMIVHFHLLPNNMSTILLKNKSNGSVTLADSLTGLTPPT